jgi:hypothetical protein
VLPSESPYLSCCARRSDDTDARKQVWNRDKPSRRAKVKVAANRSS